MGYRGAASTPPTGRVEISSIGHSNPTVRNGDSPRQRTIENSPAFQGWVKDPKKLKAGFSRRQISAVRFTDQLFILSSLDPSSKLLGYCRSPLARTQIGQLSLLESFARGAKGFVRVDALNFTAAKFFKPPCRLSKPQFFGTVFAFIIKRRDQTLRELHAISQWQFHRIGRELIQVTAHSVVRIAERVGIDKSYWKMLSASADE